LESVAEAIVGLAPVVADAVKQQTLAIQELAAAAYQQTDALLSLQRAVRQQTSALTDQMAKPEKVTFERDNKGRITVAKIKDV
jgi:hypothetical protein